MSRFMQIRIHLEPFYRPSLAAHFPKLARALEEMRVSDRHRQSTLYDLIHVLERAEYDDTVPAWPGSLKRRMPELLRLRGLVEEKLAAWKLEGLDELLYSIEDTFEELERDLD